MGTGGTPSPYRGNMKVIFGSRYAGLMTDVMVGKESRIIRFTNGVYSTDDAEIIAQLLKKSDIFEITENSPPVETIPKPKIVKKVATDTAGGVLGDMELTKEEKEVILKERGKG